MAVYKNCSYYFAELLQQSSNVLFLFLLENYNIEIHPSELLFIIEKFEWHKN